MLAKDPRLSRFSSGTGSLSSGSTASLVPTGSSAALPELGRRFSSEAKTALFPIGDSAGGDWPPSELPASRVREANSGPSGASSGFEPRSVPRVRPMPALEEDMRRKSIGFASGGTWLRLVGCELFDGNRVECTEGAGALL